MKAALLPHYKCVGCRMRLHSSVGPADLVGDLCPGCGSLLEPVEKLADIVGFQSIGRSSEGIADRLDALYARRVATDTRRKADAIALPVPDETP